MPRLVHPSKTINCRSVGETRANVHTIGTIFILAKVARFWRRVKKTGCDKNGLKMISARRSE